MKSRMKTLIGKLLDWGMTLSIVGVFVGTVALLLTVIVRTIHGNLAQKTAAVASSYSMSDHDDFFFRDGIFWGALAVSQGATNFKQAETMAYRLRAEAASNRVAHETELKRLKLEGVTTSSVTIKTNKAKPKTLGDAIAEGVVDGLVSGLTKGLEGVQKRQQADQIEFDHAVTNRNNWRIVRCGDKYTAEFRQKSNDWHIYSSLFNRSKSVEETEKDIQFYIDYFKREQASRTNVWVPVPPEVKP